MVENGEEKIFKDLIERFERYRDINPKEKKIDTTHGVLFTNFVVSSIEEKNFSELFDIPTEKFEQNDLRGIHNEIMENILNHNEIAHKKDNISKFFKKEIDFAEIDKVLYKRGEEVCCLNIKYYSIQNKYIIITAEDITETLEDILILENLIEENLDLIKEVHHRVRNNIQVLMSIINLEENFKKTPERINEFLKLSLSSMSILYSQLYSSNLSIIDIQKMSGDYKINLESYYSDLDIQFNFSSENDIYINIDQANPILLALNKLVLNSKNHAFDSIDEKIINCSFTKENGNLIISYNDNGGKTVDKTKESYGWMILETLIKQADGEIKKVDPEKYDVKITIPLSQEEDDFHTLDL